MNPIDIVLGGIVALGAFQGFRKGLVRELTAIVALFGGYWAARSFSGVLTPLLTSWIDIPQEWHSWISFFVLFVLAVYLITLVGKVLTKLLKWIALGLLNRLAGAAFGAAKWILILSLGLYFFERFNQWVILIHPDQLSGSQLYVIFQGVGDFFLDELSRVDLNKIDPPSTPII